MAELETVTVSGLPNAATPLTGSERVLLDQATGSVLAASALVAGKAYRIEVVGTTNWLACGVPSGVTPAVGLTFKATAPGSGTGTAVEVRTVDAPVQAIADLADAGAGTVTSVALSAPAGFSVSGSPVTTAGTLALSFAAGYSLPADSRQEDWDAAFTQRRTWDGGSQHLNAANGRASLQLGSAAQAAATDFATAVQGGKADTAIQPGTLTTALAGKADLVGGLVPSSQLPGFVDDVLEFANLAAFPATGETGKIYVSLATGRIYRWSGSVYIELVGSPGSTDAVPEGSVNLYFTTLRGQTAASSWWASYASSVGQALVTAGDSAAARSAISAEQAGAAAAAVSAHAAATDPHPAYALETSLGSAAQSPASDFVSATATRAANLVFAGPTSGAAAAPTFRALVTADLPAGVGGGTKTLARFTARHNQPPAINFATLDTRNSVSVLEFDAAADETAVFLDGIPEGANLSAGVDIFAYFWGDTATSGNVRWEFAIERMNTDVDADSFDTAGLVTTTTAATSGVKADVQARITTIDGLTAGDPFRLRVRRIGTDAVNDTMAGDAQLFYVEVRGVA